VCAQIKIKYIHNYKQPSMQKHSYLTLKIVIENTINPKAILVLIS